MGIAIKILGFIFFESYSLGERSQIYSLHFSTLEATVYIAGIKFGDTVFLMALDISDEVGDACFMALNV